MEAAELDNLLEELETRVERLRSLYDQYFLGIEKIPPAVAQKDVDRRIYVLRREQIRNTAKRFKLQTIIQRYNTFQQYWMRVLREIENGTYRRHVLRAEQTVGVANLLTSAERKRLGLREREDESTIPPTTAEADPSCADLRTVPPESQAAGAPPSTAAQVSALPPPVPSPANQVKAQIEHDLTNLLDDLDELDTGAMRALDNELDDPLAASMPPPPRGRQPSAKPLARRSTRPNAAPQHPRLPHERRFQRDSMPPSSPDSPLADTDGKTPMRPQRRSARPSRMAPAVPAQGAGATAKAGLRLPATSAVAGRGLPPLPKSGTPRGAPVKVPGKPIISVEGGPPTEPNSAGSTAKSITRPEPPVKPADTKSLPRPEPPAIPADTKSLPRPEPPVKPAETGSLPRPEPPVKPAETGSIPRSERASAAVADQSAARVDGPAAPQKADSPRPPAKPFAPKSAPPIRQSPRVSEARADAQPTPPPKPSQRPPPAPPSPPSRRAQEPPPKPQSRQQLQTQAAAPEPATKGEPAQVLERSKVEQLAEKLRVARTQTREANEVSVDALAKKLQVAAEELHRKHLGRRIDFDVVIKDGKAIVKPIVR